MNRREFVQLLGIAAAGGMALDARAALTSLSPDKLYDIPPFGNLHFLHFTDCHAQLQPIYLREASINLGVGDAAGEMPHLVGEKLRWHLGLKPNSLEAYAFTNLNFESAAQAFGKVGGFAHLATLVKRLRASRPGSILLDGGDSWQGSATALWTRGQDMVDVCLKLGVEIMTGHWEMTLGQQRVKEIVGKDFKGRLDFIAQNISTADFGDPVFRPYVTREMNGVPVAIFGQAFPYAPLTHPRHLFPDWSFGIQEANLQRMVNEVRGKGVKVVVLLSHCGMDIDIKLASRMRGIDAILGGHTHDGVPTPTVVGNAGGKTLVTNAGSNGKFLGVLDFDFHKGQIHAYRYRLLPVFSKFLPADAEMEALIKRIRAPFAAKLNEKLAMTEGTLYRRGNFNGSFDQLIVDALIEVKGADIAFSPGFRWGTSLLPDSPILMEHLMDQTATTYSTTTLTEMSGASVKETMEDAADNLFNPDPYRQLGDDMLRVGGMTYTIAPRAKMGSRISDMRLDGEPLQADKMYKVAGWAPLAESAKGEPVWDVLAQWLRAKKTVAPPKLNTPRVIGMKGNPGVDD
jgi:sulfur-oxidizing protein SoxB